MYIDFLYYLLSLVKTRVRTSYFHSIILLIVFPIRYKYRISDSETDIAAFYPDVINKIIWIIVSPPMSQAIHSKMERRVTLEPGLINPETADATGP